MAKRQLPKPTSKVRAGLSIARDYLQELAGQLYWACSTNNHIDYGLYKEIERRKMLKDKREQLKYLKKQKLIEMEKIGKRVIVRLTEKGWGEALRDRIKSERTRCKNGFCFVLFDVPEKERFARDTLRDFLKECGFKRLQHSVWMTDREVIEPLCELLQCRKLERWIRIVQGHIIAASHLDRLVIRQNYRS